jgi:hypothetical protein
MRPAANVQPFTNILNHLMPTGIYLEEPQDKRQSLLSGGH